MGKVNRYSIGIKTGVETRSFKKYSTSEIKRLIAKYNDDAKIIDGTNDYKNIKEYFSNNGYTCR